MASLPPFPFELVAFVVAAADKPTLAALAQTCKAVNAIATPLLYRRLILTRRNAARLFSGLEHKAKRKPKPVNKKQWNAELRKFAAAFKTEMEAEKDMAGIGWPANKWSSDPETDDDEEDEEVVGAKARGKKGRKGKPVQKNGEVT